MISIILEFSALSKYCTLNILSEIQYIDRNIEEHLICDWKKDWGGSLDQRYYLKVRGGSLDQRCYLKDWGGSLDQRYYVKDWEVVQTNDTM